MLTRQKRVRTRLSWSPIWEGPIQAVAKTMIGQNRWRCDPIHEFEDLLQDAYLIFIKICDKYPRVTEPRHFMALFKVALWNQFHDKARYVKLKRRVVEDTPKDVSEWCVGCMGERTNAGFLSVLLDEAPEELKTALVVIQQNPKELHQRRRRRENLNAKLSRVIGYHYDYSGQLRNLLTHER